MRLAELLETHCPALIDASCAALLAVDNAIVRQPTALTQMREHYRLILADVVASLRAGAIQIDDGYKLNAWEIGTSRALAGVHPGESLQAGSVFYETVLASAALLVPDEPGGLTVFEFAAQALQASITQRVREAFAVYTSFLLNKVYEAQTEERQRIARDLHDRIGHCISVAHHQLELSELYQHTDAERSAEKVRTAHRAVRDAMENLRSVATGLHSARPHKNLESALISDIGEIDTSGIDIRIRVNGDEAWADTHTLDECTLMLREAARNALEHARPSVLIVNVDITPDQIRALVEDDGTGFDVQRVRPGGVGLAAMRERTDLLGGAVSMQSRIGTGTQIRFVIPLGAGVR